MNHRTELHLHTKMSADTSVISAEELFEIALKHPLTAVAVTDLNTVQSFPEIMNLQQRYKKNAPKIIYGAELGYWSDGAAHPYRMTLLAKNQAGIKELYTVISSLSELETSKYSPVTEIIDPSVLQQNRAHLLCGSCGQCGELFAALLGHTTSEITERYYVKRDLSRLNGITDGFEM